MTSEVKQPYRSRCESLDADRDAYDLFREAFGVVMGVGLGIVVIASLMLGLGIIAVKVGA